MAFGLTIPKWYNTSWNRETKCHHMTLIKTSFKECFFNIQRGDPLDFQKRFLQCQGGNFSKKKILRFWKSLKYVKNWPEDGGLSKFWHNPFIRLGYFWDINPGPAISQKLTHWDQHTLHSPLTSQALATPDLVLYVWFTILPFLALPTSYNLFVLSVICTSQRPWVRFWGPKIAAASCTHLGPAQVMEVIIIDL